MLLVLVGAAASLAQDRPVRPPRGSAGATVARRATAPAAPPPSEGPGVPVLSDQTQWVRNLLVSFAGLFVVAALMGPVLRKEHPEDLPPTHSHDEPPGASHHHGAGGMVDFSAPETKG
ncbi:MAG TPA: hypothetical protein VH475_05955 [Tepidisphaeraceae bacterium]